MTGGLGQHLHAALSQAQRAPTPTGTLTRAPSTIEGSGGARLTAEEVLSTAETLARALFKAQITPSEPVLCQIGNEPHALAVLLGTWLAGGVAVPLHAAAARTTVEQVRRATGARLRIVGGELEQISPEPAPARELLRDAALIVFTSGSTGQPKGVVLAHPRLLGKLRILDRLLQFTPDDTVVVPLQLSFIFGIWVSLLSILSGARLQHVAKFSAEAVGERLAQGASVLAVVPSMLRALLAPTRAPAAPHLRTLLTGGESLGHQLNINACKAFPHTSIYDLYGLTETGSCDFCLLPSEFAAGIGSIGTPTEGVNYRIVDERGAPAKPGAAGELLIKTPFGMLGYLDDPDLSAASFVDGYLRSGDQARLGTDGRVAIVGRLKEIISRGGNKIAPAEIDALLMRHPQVSGALCAGIPDPRLGEAIGAVVTLVPGAGLTGQELRSWALGQIETFKVPDIVAICDTLPTGSTGKLSRAAVARCLAATSRSRP
jgi:acyl-CoA synthetase (AMP-forming)/AMP-acid ligase II